MTVTVNENPREKPLMNRLYGVGIYMLVRIWWIVDSDNGWLHQTTEEDCPNCLIFVLSLCLLGQ